MKKTISVNIKGLSFTIEEDAYELLQEYLERLELALGNQSGKKEIIEDIELRIAELFSGRLNESKTVIELMDVQQILNNLGNPEDFVDQDEDDEDNENSAFENATRGPNEKRLFRDEDNAAIGGVCAGIANYFNVDVVLIRIIFVIILLFAGFGFPLYIILWIVIPKAKNTIDRLRMKGHPITVETVKAEVENAAERIKVGSRRFAKKMRNTEGAKQKLSHGARIFSSIIGMILIGIGLLHLVAFLVLILGGTELIPVQSESGFLSLTEFGELMLSNSKDVTWAWAGGTVFIVSIILFFFLLGSILIFYLRNRWARLSLLGLILTGVIGFFMCLNVALNAAGDFAIDGEIERAVGDVNTSELVILPEKESLTEDEAFRIKSNGEFGLMSLEGNRIREYGIHFEYRESKDSLFHIFQNLSARSHSHKRALEKSQNIQHNVRLQGDSLLVEAEYTFPKRDKLRDQDVLIIIEIPEGGQVKFRDKVIHLSGDDEKIDHRYNNEDGYLSGDGCYKHNDWWH